jgi:hypothetical protein
MNKTLIIAATLLSLSAGAAFAGDGDVYALPAQVSQTHVNAQDAPQHRLFPASTREQTDIYGLFGDGSGGLRGGGSR